MKVKVVIANSIGIDECGNRIVHFPSRWTASVGKSEGFTYYPYELAYLSSLLKRETNHDIKFVDGNLLKLTANEYIRVIEKENPDILIMETSTMVYDEDLKVAKAIKEKSDTKLIFTGQHPSAHPEKVLADGVDYVCVGEYEFTVLDILTGKNPKTILGLYPNKRRPLLDINQLPFPEDEDVSRFDYAVPGEPSCEYKEIEMFASRGCPMSCIFCVARNVYYAQPNWRQRNIKSIIDEIKYLRSKYPQMEGIFFNEEEHNARKEFIINLAKAIKENKLDDLKYSAMCGYWTLDREMLEAMHDAGYYKLRIGIETTSDTVAKAMGKRIDISKVKFVLKVAKEVGMKMYGTFTFGAPDATIKEDMKTVKLIKELVDNDLLYDLQMSICTPQPGTPFYNGVKEKGYLISTDWRDYDGSTCAVVSYPDYSNKEIEQTFRLACDAYANARLNRDIRQFGIKNIIKNQVSKDGMMKAFFKGIRELKRYAELKRKLQ